MEKFVGSGPNRRMPSRPARAGLAGLTPSGAVPYRWDGLSTHRPFSHARARQFRRGFPTAAEPGRPTDPHHTDPCLEHDPEKEPT